MLISEIHDFDKIFKLSVGAYLVRIRIHDEVGREIPSKSHLIPKIFYYFSAFIRCFCVLLAAIISCCAITLKCSFKTDFVWKKYGCEVKELNNENDNTVNENHNARITQIQGHHENMRSSDEVFSLRIENIRTIEYFTNDFFVKFPNIQSLVIHKTSLKFLLRGDFAMADNLVNIHITHTDLTDLEDYVFHGTRILKMLNLRENKIRGVAENAFKGLSTLKFLTLSFNEIQSLHVNVFKDLSYLEQLSLSTNKIQHIDEHLFTKNRNLEIIFLDHNQLKAINGNMFSRNEKLREIYLDNNHIKHISNIPNFLNNLADLEVAVFNNNTCVSTMILIMNKFYPPYTTLFAGC